MEPIDARNDSSVVQGERSAAVAKRQTMNQSVHAALRPERAMLKSVHHGGVSVSSLEQALDFWEGFLEVSARWQTVLDRPYLGQHVGYPGVRIAAAFLDLPGGGTLELLEYLNQKTHPSDPASANPGHMHLCLAVEKIEKDWKRALTHGAIPVHHGGPVTVDGGPNRGARVAYLRVPPDRTTLELFQTPDVSRSTGGETA